MTEPVAKQEVVPSDLRRIKSALPTPVKAALRGTARTYGVATSSWRTSPDFLIIGTKRGGTTSLWNALVNHGDVVPMFPATQEIKSPHYFDIDYSRGERWYRSHFATRRARSRHESKYGRRAVTGEASPYYMYHPLAAARIADELPNIKLIVSLRNPVDRIWSHYHERVAGHTERLSFDDAIAAEADRLAGEEDRIISEQPDYYSFHHDLSSYLARGRYWEHLSRFYELFDERQILVLRAEDYYQDPSAELGKLARFLGIDPAGFQLVEQYNRIPRSSMPAGTRARLVDYYRPHVDALETALGRPFGWSDFTATADRYRSG